MTTQPLEGKPAVTERASLGRMALDTLRAIRVYQWVKNSLLFVPLLTAHELGQISLIFDAVIAFFAFSVCASGVYVVNDLWDLESDRRHPTKRNRPFAAGRLPVTWGVALAPMLLLGGLGLAALALPQTFLLVLALYLVLTTLYTFVLKRVIIVDVLLLAGLYTLRVLAGGAATEIPISPWLTEFSLFLFLSLAFVKRFSELLVVQEQHRTHAKGRGYQVGDLPMLRSLGPSSGYLAAVVFALYIHSDKVKALYKHPDLLWGMLPLLVYWITRMWFLAERGEMKDDPIVSMVKDPASYVVGALVGLLMLAANF